MNFPGHLGSRITPFSRRRRANPRGSHRLGRLELLEERQLLAANVLDTTTAIIANAGDSRAVQMSVAIPNAPTGTQASLMFAVNPANGSSLDPAAVTVRDGAGNALSSSAAIHDYNGRGSLTTVPLSAGNYSVVVSGSNATAGSFELVVYLAGDIFPAAAVVDDFEFLYSQAALSQSSGTGNFVTDTFYQSRGIDMSQNLYNPGMDVDGNGVIGPTDVQAVQRNHLAGRVDVTLQSDVEAPAVTPRLLNDTGVSNTDRITTDPTIVGSIVDDSTIASFQVQLDSGPLTSALGRITNGNFTFDRAFLNSLSTGGTLTAGSHTLRFFATDEPGNTIDPAIQFSFVFIDQNVAPTVGTIPAQSATQDVAFSANLGGFFSDANPGDVVLFSSPNLPGWLTLNATTGAVTGTPRNADVGARTITLRGTDSQGAFIDSQVTINVQNVNDPPVIAPIPNQNAPVGNPFSLNLSNFISDPDPGATFDTLEVAVQQVDSIDNNGNLVGARPLPAWLTYNATTGILSGTPTQADVGTFTVGVVVTDEFDGIATRTFTITVAGNRAPTVTDIPDASTAVGTAFNRNLSTFFSDPDGDALTFSIVASQDPLPAWLTFNGTTGVLSGTPGAGDVGSLALTVTATDTGGLSVSDTFTLTVTPAPVGTINVALRTLDTDGNEITSIVAGGQFDLVVTVQDIRAENPPQPRGVFSAFVDVTYNGTLASPTGQFIHNFNGTGVYTAGTSGATVNNGTVDAELDEVGGTDGISPLGTGIFELFRIRFTAGSTSGSLTFASNPADQRTLHPILLFGGIDNVPDSEVNFGTTVLTVGALTPPLSGTAFAPRHNADNPLDVNGDSMVSPLDALLVINQLNSSAAARPTTYVDVNADGKASPLDALLVINHLATASRPPTAPMSSGVVFGGDDDEGNTANYVQDAVFATGDFW